MTTSYRRQVGTVRPSHLMYTGGVGALIDLPSLSVLVRGLDDWDYSQALDSRVLNEDRLLAAVQRTLANNQIAELRSAPWREPAEGQGNDPADLVGVPVLVFPQWLRCTYPQCNELAPIDAGGGVWHFENENPNRPDLARFTHALCKKRGTRKPLAVAARFVLACRNGHLDDFPYREFVHRGGDCPHAPSGARLRMVDNAGNAGPNVTITCLACGMDRNMMAASGRGADLVLPQCRGRHPHLGTFQSCMEPVRLLIVGASNQWFAEALSALAVPHTGADELQAEVTRLWDRLAEIPSLEVLNWALGNTKELHALRGYEASEVMAAIDARRKELETGEGATTTDLRAPEWEVFTSSTPPEASSDFAVRRPGIHPDLQPLLADVVQVERMREVKAFVGFTRIDAPDLINPEATPRAPISRNRATWVPASEVRGEGIFLRLHEALVADWEDRAITHRKIRIHRAAYRQFRENRRPKDTPEFDPNKGWPGPRFMALHTLSHLLIRRIAIECGYSAATLAERLYTGNEEEPRTGILIYTAAPDSDGTLGGLVSLAAPDTLRRLLRGALDDARHCSSDPLCAETLPYAPADFLHGAACHICMFVSETTCERGNRFLDRRLLVDLGDPDLVLTPAGL